LYNACIKYGHDDEDDDQTLTVEEHGIGQGGDERLAIASGRLLLRRRKLVADDQI